MLVLVLFLFLILKPASVRKQSEPAVHIMMRYFHPIPIILRMGTYLGIFLISAATLLFELSLTRVFSVLFYHHFAFLMISTALFGFGFSGIVLFLRKRRESELSKTLCKHAIAFSLSILVIYKLILLLPYGFKGVMDDPTQVLRLVIQYGLLVIPFFFSGSAIGLILSSFPEKSGRYYFFDLAGAALGCIAVLWFVPWLGAGGSIIVSSFLAAASAVCFWPKSSILKGVSFGISLLTIALAGFSDIVFQLPMSRIFEEKHGQFYKAPQRKIEYSAWSSVSRLDVLVTPPNRLLYLDGGSNVSFLVKFNGDFDRLEPRVNWRTVPYMLSPRKTVCIIGPGGGEDVLNAISQKAESITAVEMDPLIVEIVQGRFKKFIGGIFNHPSVQLVNDEGRSFLQRSGKQYDLIQTVHNCSPMALASGALNLSESYLFTVEAFREYWRRLKPGGMLSIHRSGVLRAASIASTVMQEEGIRDPENYVVGTGSLRGGGGGGSAFYWKKGKFSTEELDQFQSLRNLRIKLLYAPLPEFQTQENVYYQLLNPALQKDFIRRADLLLDAPTDNRPFFEHHQRFGSFQRTTTILPDEFELGLRFHNLGDLALLTLLAEALVLSFIFIVFPLFRLKNADLSIPKWPVLVYFSAIGLGFILIEISLFQKHILFVGQPVYSIACVLFSLLLSTGIGSLLFQKYFRSGMERKWLYLAAAGVSATLAFEVFLVPSIFEQLLGVKKWMRFVISGLLISPLGLTLGIPFPLGVRILGERSPSLIPWGWGLNAYMTVVGSILCVIFALTFGFRANFMIALVVYFAGFLTFSRILRND